MMFLPGKVELIHAQVVYVGANDSDGGADDDGQQEDRRGSGGHRYRNRQQN